MNGMIPKNADTDSSLSKLSGGAFDLKTETQQSNLTKQLSGKLTNEQLMLLTSDPDTLQTLIFVLFLIRFAPKLMNQYKRQLDKSIRSVNKKLGNNENWKQKDFKTLADSLIF